MIQDTLSVNNFSARIPQIRVPNVPVLGNDNETRVTSSIVDEVLISGNELGQQEEAANTYKPPQKAILPNTNTNTNTQVSVQSSAKFDKNDPTEIQFRELFHKFIGQVLFGQMLKSMRATQEKNPYFHGGRAEEIFQDELDNILVEQITKSTTKNLSDPMYNQFQRQRFNE
ncbi:MAG: rod-binding protein [Planctomycetaceae bacterium]|jgi:hypothetical protein|nr:rod-binding protein [Planctomycetaceae bacterium]